MQDIIDHTKETGNKLMICGLDLESAYDKIDHLYMDRLLQKMNVGTRFKNCLNMIYNNMYSCVSINGAKTKYFKLTRSIRQGDPIAGACFVMAIEPLANLIRADRTITPMSIPNQPDKKVSQYADDTSTCSGATKDYHTIISHAKTFEKGAGAKLNETKTEVLLMGNWTPDEIKEIPEQNVKKNIKFNVKHQKQPKKELFTDNDTQESNTIIISCIKSIKSCINQ